MAAGSVAGTTPRRRNLQRPAVVSHRSMTVAIAMLFFSSIIIWPLPWMAGSASLM
jgi:hypothetical protein